MRSRALLLAALMLAAVLVGCEQGTPAGEGAGDGDGGPIEVGEAAPDFSLPAADGSEVSLADHRGSAVLLYFSMGPG
jgi:cytochrome oxidase Cu insertion factor (SCO1/SenC/PrrC family)